MTSRRMETPSRRLTAVNSRATGARALRSARPIAKSQPGQEGAEPEIHVPAFLRATSESERIDQKSRADLIAEAAYLRAASRGFESGHELDDWLAAEKSVDARLAGEVKR
jgi:hypothetical protein